MAQSQILWFDVGRDLAATKEKMKTFFRVNLANPMKPGVVLLSLLTLFPSGFGQDFPFDEQRRQKRDAEERRKKESLYETRQKSLSGEAAKKAPTKRPDQGKAEEAKKQKATNNITVIRKEEQPSSLPIDLQTGERNIDWQKQQAAAGDPRQQFKLGVRYLTGDGVEKDEAQAKILLKKAADQGHSDAAAKLKSLQ